MHKFIVFSLLVYASSVASKPAVDIIPVVGVQTGIDSKSREPPPRLNINDLQKSGPAW